LFAVLKASITILEACIIIRKYYEAVLKRLTIILNIPDAEKLKENGFESKRIKKKLNLQNSHSTGTTLALSLFSVS
jgi:hypothetical protein